jgi:hypothetical protein
MFCGHAALDGAFQGNENARRGFLSVPLAAPFGLPRGGFLNAALEREGAGAH